MIQEIKITDIKEITELLIEQEYNSHVQRHRSSLLYRGLTNGSYTLETSMQRNCKKEQKNLEVCILRNFTKYAATEDPQLKESIWRQLIIGQHHELPTRLLDWTFSPLIGLHFATGSKALSSMDKNDCILWRIDSDEINGLLPEYYQSVLRTEKAHLFTVDMLHNLVSDLSTYDSDMGNKAMVVLEPPSIDQRIINQYSYFMVVPLGIENIEEFLNSETNHTVKYIIDKSLKWRIRDMLDQMNINERIVYPGLDGLSTWLKRHYYVRDDESK